MFRTKYIEKKRGEERGVYWLLLGVDVSGTVSLYVFIMKMYFYMYL